MMDKYQTVVEAVGGSCSLRRFAVAQRAVVMAQRRQVRSAVLSEIVKGPDKQPMVCDVLNKSWIQDEEEYLFDLKSDPLQQNNLAGNPEHPATQNELRTEGLT